MHFILGAKPGDHEFLFDQVIAAIDKDRVTTISWKAGDGEAAISFVNNVPLNEANQELLVNFFHYVEYRAGRRDEESLYFRYRPAHYTQQCPAPGPRRSCPVED